MRKHILTLLAFSIVGSFAPSADAGQWLKRDTVSDDAKPGDGKPADTKIAPRPTARTKPTASVRLARTWGKKYGLSTDEVLEQAEMIDEAVGRTRGPKHEGFEVPDKYDLKYRTLHVPKGSKRTAVVMRSSQPSPENLVELTTAAKKAGIQPHQIAVLNFRAENDAEETYVRDFASSSDADERAAGKLSMVPIRTLDHTIFRNEQVVQALNVMRDPKYKLVLAHCKAGKARTGQVVAIMRVVLDGWSLDAALDEAKERGLRRPLQIAYVRQFVADWKAGKIKLDGSKT